MTIVDTIEAIFSLADAREWEGLRALLADSVRVDYTSLAGGEPADVPAGALIDAWTTGLTRFVRTQHLIKVRDVSVDGDRAVAHAVGMATHEKEPERWTCGGRYRLELVGSDETWRLAAITFVLEWEQGER